MLIPFSLHEKNNLDEHNDEHNYEEDYSENSSSEDMENEKCNNFKTFKFYLKYFAM